MGVRLDALYQEIRSALRGGGIASPDLEARLLVAHAICVRPNDVLLRLDDEISEENSRRIRAMLEQRLDGVPIGRLTGRREFWGLEFFLNDDTLEPRPDTEILVEAVLARSLPDSAPFFVDVGTGTGAIAIALLHEMESARCVAVDISQNALEQAILNAAHHGVGDRFLPLCSDYLAALAVDNSVASGIDWVISNPPYIRSEVISTLSREVQDHDPLRALDGGEDGLIAYRQLVRDGLRLLRPGGRIALEIGFDQGAEVQQLLADAGFEEIELLRDLASLDRVLVARKTHSGTF